MNVPYLVLEQASGPTSPLQDKTREVWEDLSYVPLESSAGRQSHCYVIYESQTTVVIAGCDHSRWIGYGFGKIGPEDLCFDDTGSFDTESQEEEAERQEREGETDLEEEEVEFEEDYFAHGGCAPLLWADDVIWDPRVYFMRATQIRLDVVTQAYEYLVRKIEAGAKDWVNDSCAFKLRFS